MAAREGHEASRVGPSPRSRAAAASSPTVTAEGSRRSAGARRARPPRISLKIGPKRPTASPTKTTGPADPVAQLLGQGRRRHGARSLQEFEPAGNRPVEPGVYTSFFRASRMGQIG